MAVSGKHQCSLPSYLSFPRKHQCSLPSYLSFPRKYQCSLPSYLSFPGKHQCSLLTFPFLESTSALFILSFPFLESTSALFLPFLSWKAPVLSSFFPWKHQCSLPSFSFLGFFHYSTVASIFSSSFNPSFRSWFLLFCLSFFLWLYFFTAISPVCDYCFPCGLILTPGTYSTAGALPPALRVVRRLSLSIQSALVVRPYSSTRETNLREKPPGNLKLE